MKKRFILCGLIGWCLEIFWTGLHSFLNGNMDMIGTTSLLMFPIYGCAALIGPISKRIEHIPVFIRGILYSTGIFTVEYITGSILKRLGVCPWDYSLSALQIDGVIRLDYFPLWFLTGLLYEKILLSYPF